MTVYIGELTKKDMAALDTTLAKYAGAPVIGATLAQLGVESLPPYPYTSKNAQTIKTTPAASGVQAASRSTLFTPEKRRGWQDIAIIVGVLSGAVTIAATIYAMSRKK